MMRKKINEDAPIGINPLRILINRVGPATRIETYYNWDQLVGYWAKVLGMLSQVTMLRIFFAEWVY